MTLWRNKGKIRIKKAFSVLLMILILTSFSFAESSKALIFPPGSYTVGEDISAGLWTILPAEDGGRVTVTFQKDGAPFTRVIVGFGKKDKGSSIVPALDMDLIDGTELVIKGAAASMEPNSGDMVWVSRKGKKYHRVADCCSMSNPLHMTEAEAVLKNRTPCSNCCK